MSFATISVVPHTTTLGPGLLLESVLAALDKMIDYSFATNIQLAAVLGSLASYSQPVLTTYLLYSDAVKSNALLKITKVRARSNASMQVIVV